MSDNTGQNIAADIAIVDQFLSPLISGFDPAIGAGLHLGLQLLSKAEPAVYNAVVAAIQGTDLTPDQVTARDEALVRLQNPGQYFADPS